MSGDVVEVGVTIVCCFPISVEVIPCCFVINKGINIQLFTYKIICHIYIGICIIHEGQHLPHHIIPSVLHFGRTWKDWSCFDHGPMIAKNGKDYKRFCDTASIVTCRWASLQSLPGILRRLRSGHGTEREPHERDGRWGRDPVESSASGRGFVFCSYQYDGTSWRFP